MPTIGLLEGFAPSRMRVRPPIILGRDYDLVPARPVSFLRRQPNYLRGDDPAALSITASIGAGAAAAQASIYNNAKQAALAAGKSDAEAHAAGQAAVAAYSASIVMSANARIAQERAEAEARRLRAIVNNPPVSTTPTHQTLIDDYQGQTPQGSRGGSGSVPGPLTYIVEPDKKEDPMMPIDTRGNPTGSFTTGAPGAGAGAGGGSKLMLPLLAVAAYYMFK